MSQWLHSQLLPRCAEPGTVVQAGIPEGIVAEASTIALQSEQEDALPQLQAGQQSPAQADGCADWPTEDLRTLHELVHNAELLAHEWQVNGMAPDELAERMQDLRQQAQSIAGRLAEQAA